VRFVIPFILHLQILCGLWFPPFYKFPAVCHSPCTSPVLWFVFPSFYKPYSVCNSLFTNAPSLILHYKLYPVCNSSFTYAAWFVNHHLKMWWGSHVQSICGLSVNPYLQIWWRFIPSLQNAAPFLHSSNSSFTNSARFVLRYLQMWWGYVQSIRGCR